MAARGGGDKGELILRYHDMFCLVSFYRLLKGSYSVQSKICYIQFNSFFGVFLYPALFSTSNPARMILATFTSIAECREGGRSIRAAQHLDSKNR